MNVRSQTALWRSRLGAILSLVVGALAGCQVQKPAGPPVAPRVEISAQHFAGSALSGALAQPIDDMAAANAWAVAVRVAAVQTLPTGDGFEPIGPKARLVLSDGSGDLIRPSSRIVYSARYRIVGSDSFDLNSVLGKEGDWADMGTHAGGVAPGSTFAVDLSQAAALAGMPGRQRIGIQIFRTPSIDGYDLALISDDRVAAPVPAQTARSRRRVQPKPSDPPQDVRETILIRREFDGDADRTLLAVPMVSADGAFAGLLIDVSIMTKPAANDPAIARMRPEILAAAGDVAKRAGQTAVPAKDMLIATALDVLNNGGDSPRAPIVYLAQQSGASLTESVALVADDRVLSLVAKAIRERAPQLPVRDAASVAWLLDRATIQTVASVNGEESQVSPLGPVKGVLAAYAGEAGRQLDLLQSLANESAGSADLQQRLVAEHFIYLEDNAPAVRVRAYDWLNVRGLAPAGFDPLADPKTRRIALEKSRNPTTNPAAPAATQP